MNKTVGYNPDEIGIEIKKWSGFNEVISVCPFHDDHSPSLSFNIESGLYYCFSCGASGNASQLALALGGTANRGRLKLKRQKDYSREWRVLLSNPLADTSDYLNRRGVTIGQIIRYGIRVNFDSNGKENGVIFPLPNHQGEIIGVCLRKFEGWPRYNYFGIKPLLYPMEEINFHPQEKTIITEGIFGFLNAKRNGLTALTTMSALVKRGVYDWLGSINPIVIFDDDFAGYLGAARVIKSVGHARAILPGLETDECSSETWKKIANGGMIPKRDLAKMAELSGDVSKFWSKV